MRFSEFSLHFFTALLLLFFVSQENRKDEKTRKKKRKRKRKKKKEKLNKIEEQQQEISEQRHYSFFSLRQGIRYYFLSFVQYVLVLAPRKDKMKRTSNFDDTSNWPRLHDLFNLSVLPIICASNFLYLLLREDFYLWAQFFVFTVYLIADSIWVLFRPLSVASPSTIIIHHTVCLIGWTIQHISDPSLSQWTSLGLLAEINAIFLIGRRYWGRTRVIQTFFYSTWIFLRLMMFPFVLYRFVFKYFDYTITESNGSFLNTGLLVLLVMVFLNVLNMKWSWDLFFRKNMEGLAGQ